MANVTVFLVPHVNALRGSRKYPYLPSEGHLNFLREGGLEPEILKERRADVELLLKCPLNPQIYFFSKMNLCTSWKCIVVIFFIF